MSAVHDVRIAGGVPGDDAKRARAAWIRAMEMTAAIARHPSVTFPMVIDNLAETFGMRVALVSDEVCWTYRALAKRANRYARWGLSRGLGPGDVIGLLMPNCAEYLAIWIGLTRIGAVVSLVNTSLVGPSLAHAIRIVGATYVIVGAELIDAFAAVLPQLDGGIRCWVHGASRHALPRIDEEILKDTVERFDGPAPPRPSIMDTALYIYTSGTTGLPKAARVSHLRVMQWSHWFAGMMDVQTSDRMYNCLPMYHSIGGVVAVGAPLVKGGSVLIRRRFSASAFWDEIARWDCTLFQYIGELCRYLADSPPRPRETEHRLRLCCGNGLRADVWERFKSRFRIPQILEFYAATENNFSLYNCEGRPGAIGRTPPFLAHRDAVALIKRDIETGAPIRNSEGFCLRCRPGEVGEAIGRIVDEGSSAGSRFEGYTDAAASERKILRNVFSRGDRWLSTGDLMRQDGDGFFYFVDRLGDTFRWKGENVSTTEVAATIAACPGVSEAVLYGVPVPGTEGRAGMAALTVGRDFDLDAFRRHLVERLPGWARPLFLRLRNEIETTVTFKPKKQDLAREGYDPAATADPLFFDDKSRRSFVAIDSALYQRIRSGALRL